MQCCCALTDALQRSLHRRIRLSVACALQGELEALTGSAFGDAEALMALAAGNQAEDEALEAEEVSPLLCYCLILSCLLLVLLCRNV